MDKQLIKHKIGHTSDAVRIYKRVSLEKPESVTDIRYHVNDEKVMQSRLWNIRAFSCSASSPTPIQDRSIIAAVWACGNKFMFYGAVAKISIVSNFII